MSARAFRVGVLLLFSAILSCASASEAPSPAATPAAARPASTEARALIEASLTRRAVRTLPAYTKMALVKLLPDVAPSVADDVDELLDEDRLFDDVARRVDEVLAPTESAALAEALRAPRIAFVMSMLIGEAAPSFRPPAGGASKGARERLFEAAMPPGRGTLIAQLPLELAARIGRAALTPEDTRQQDLARFLAKLPTLPRLEERDSFVAALAAAHPDEVADAFACFLEGPCARAHAVLHDAHVGAARDRARALEDRLRARARPSPDR